MNNSSILIWYDTGNCEEIHLPDPPYEAGLSLQREYIDCADPDGGIFLERLFVLTDEVTGGAGRDGDADCIDAPYSELTCRMRIVDPDALESALLVIAHGTTMLMRDPLAQSRCGLMPCAVSELGFGPDDAQRGAGFFAAGLRRCLDSLGGLGEDGVAAAEDAISEWRGRCGRQGGEDDGANGTIPLEGRPLPAIEI